MKLKKDVSKVQPRILCLTKIQYYTLHKCGANRRAIVFVLYCHFMFVNFPAILFIPCICTCTSMSSVSPGLGVKSLSLCNKSTDSHCPLRFHSTITPAGCVAGCVFCGIKGGGCCEKRVGLLSDG